ncbi:MAG: PKD repeat protein [Paraglaciecola sp.]|jgi:PKD repeat protein
MRIKYLTILVTAILSTTALAAPGTPGAPAEQRMYGQAAPFDIKDLPNSKLKKQLEDLPIAAQERAVKWLNSFSFPANDIANINVDKRGGVFYMDTEIPEQITQADLEENPLQVGIDPADTFILHSKPGAENVVYVNFVGFNFSGTAWNNYTGVSNYEAKPYDRDGNSASFSASERAAIGEIWHRIAEDFAPFDIDVTTEAPAAFGPKVGHILITSGTDAKGDLLPGGSSSGGIAYVGVWGRSDFPTYQPALVYYDNLGAGNPTYVAEAASHELGHNLDLSHDGTSAAGYYTGHGSGVTSWAPIMGVGYYQNVTQWSNGEYFDANNPQDDLSIIQNKLTYRNDDHGNDAASASALLVDNNGFIASSNPEFDPLNVRKDNKGVIENATDTDVFHFYTASGDISLNINPAWDAYTRTSRRGANLDIKATLFDDLGIVIVDDVLSETNAVISINVVEGRYYLAVEGVGNASTPYSDYGSLSQYYISGSVVPISPDTTPPNPIPTLVFQATSRTAIDMSSTESFDDSGVVEYQFICSAGGLGCVASDWQPGTNYVAAGLDNNTNYSYQVKARDAAGNETSLSDVVIMTTDANNAPVTLDDNQVMVNENTATTIDVLINDTDADGDSLVIDSLSVSQHGDLTINDNKIIYTPDSTYVGNDSFSYTVSDGYGGYSTSTVNLTVNADTNTAPTAVISASTTSGTGPLLVLFDAASSFDDDSIALYSWGFGDGNTATGIFVDNTYTAAGSYIATLTVTDNGGKTSSTTIAISVIAQAIAPAAPTALSATLVKTGKGKNKVISRAELNWVDNSNNEKNFVIERCLKQTTGKGKKTVITCDYSGYSNVEEGVNNVQVSTESGYMYRVKATNDTGSSNYTNEVSI